MCCFDNKIRGDTDVGDAYKVYLSMRWIYPLNQIFSITIQVSLFLNVMFIFW